MGQSMRVAERCGAPSSTAFSTRRSLPALWTASNLAAKLGIPRLINIGVPRPFGATRDVLAQP